MTGTREGNAFHGQPWIPAGGLAAAAAAAAAASAAAAAAAAAADDDDDDYDHDDDDTGCLQELRRNSREVSIKLPSPPPPPPPPPPPFHPRDMIHRRTYYIKEQASAPNKHKW
jgi:hypothetical protein